MTTGLKNQVKLQNTRNAMKAAGWVFAVDNLPGVYVPGPNIQGTKVTSHWVVSCDNLRVLIRQFSADPAIHKLFEENAK